jgi:hypothetical protein
MDNKINPKKNPFLKKHNLRFFQVCDESGNTIAQAGFVAQGYFAEMPKTGMLVLPDFIENQQAFSALMDFLKTEAKKAGCESLLGPFNPNIHYDVGVQFSYFEETNASFMGYQPKYYHQFFEKYGYKTSENFYSWHLSKSTFLPTDSILKLERKISNQSGLCIRPIELKHYSRELKIFHHLYSDCFSDHWAFVPPDFDEFKFIAGDLKYILKDEMALIAEWHGQPIGFVLGIPDVFEVIYKKFKGKLNIHSVASLWVHYKKIKNSRVMIAGVLPEFRHTGAHLPLFLQVARNIFKLGFTGGQIAWVMDNNQAMNRILPQIGAEKKQGYRVYEMLVNSQ